MNSPKKLVFPLKERKILEDLKAGDWVLISGTIYTARDQTHQKLLELIRNGKNLPLKLKDQLFYYVGPTPAPPGRVIGSAGPTTSYRMDPYTPELLKLGLAATMGKGKRSTIVKEAMKKYKAIYLAAFGGAGAYLTQYIKKAFVFAFSELGPEALYCLEVENFPAIVINDFDGKDFYELARLISL